MFNSVIFITTLIRTLWSSHTILLIQQFITLVMSCSIQLAPCFSKFAKLLRCYQHLELCRTDSVVAIVNFHKLISWFKSFSLQNQFLSASWKFSQNLNVRLKQDNITMNSNFSSYNIILQLFDNIDSIRFTNFLKSVRVR